MFVCRVYVLGFGFQGLRFRIWHLVGITPTLLRAKLEYFINPTPATKGANVRTIGTNQACLLCISMEHTPTLCNRLQQTTNV